MASVRTKGTAPELLVRSVLHELGFRFRLHRRDLPGTPDIVLPRHRAIVFVHGCFWHGHHCRRGALPTSNVQFWAAKRAKNVERDRTKLEQLGALGWRVLVVWECETKDRRALGRQLRRFLAFVGL